MKISKTHQNFSDYLKQPDALTNPGKYLGPNWLEVLNFWIYIDTLNEQEINQIANRYYALVFSVRWSAFEAASIAADDVVGWKFRSAAWRVAVNVTKWWIFGDATLELIGHHKLLEQGKTLTFLSLCIKS